MSRSRSATITVEIPVQTLAECLGDYQAAARAVTSQPAVADPYLPPVKPRTTSAYNVATSRTRSRTLRVPVTP